MHGRTGVWDHQISPGLSSVSLAWVESRLGRMDLGQPGLESETLVQSATAEAGRPKGLRKYRTDSLKTAATSIIAESVSLELLFQRIASIAGEPFAFKDSSPLPSLSPTGC